MLNKEQLEVIDLLATTDLSNIAIAEKVGINNGTISKWKNDDEFTAELLRVVRRNLYQDLPDVYKALVKYAKLGQIAHIKTLLEHLTDIEKLHMANTTGNITFTWSM